MFIQKRWIKFSVRFWNGCWALMLGNPEIITVKTYILTSVIVADCELSSDSDRNFLSLLLNDGGGDDIISSVK
jgi:hypothetical protein